MRSVRVIQFSWFTAAADAREALKLTERYAAQITAASVHGSYTDAHQTRVRYEYSPTDPQSVVSAKVDEIISQIRAVTNAELELTEFEFDPVDHVAKARIRDRG